MMKRACLILLCLIVLLTESTAKPGPIDFSELDKLVTEELKEKNTPGAVITVVSGDQVVYQKAFGVANVETNAPMQPEMLFRATELGLGLKDGDPPKPAALAPVTTSEMNEYVGTYSHAPQTWEVSVKDGKLYVKFDGKEHVATKSGERKFTFGEQNENEIVFVPGKDGKIGFLFTELYGAKKIK